MTPKGGRCCSGFEAFRWRSIEQLQQRRRTMRDRPRCPWRNFSRSCSLCGRQFPSQAALDGHLSKTHAKLSFARPHAHGPVCVVCLKHLRGRPAVIRHLGRPGCKCLQVLKDHFVPLMEAQCSKLDSEDLIIMKEHARAGRPKTPVVRTSGPLSYFASIAGLK